MFCPQNRAKCGADIEKCTWDCADPKTLMDNNCDVVVVAVVGVQKKAHLLAIICALLRWACIVFLSIPTTKPREGKQKLHHEYPLGKGISYLKKFGL